MSLLDWSSLFCFATWWWVRPFPIMQCAHQSRNGTCVASCSSLSLCVGLFLGPALTRQSGAANSCSPSISSLSSLDISSRFFRLHSILSLHFVAFFLYLLFHLCTMLPALQACRKRLDHSLCLPAENWTCFIEANPRPLCTHHCSRPAWSLCRLECFECADSFRPAQQCFHLGRRFAMKWGVWQHSHSWMLCISELPHLSWMECCSHPSLWCVVQLLPQTSSVMLCARVWHVGTSSQASHDLRLQSPWWLWHSPTCLSPPQSFSDSNCDCSPRSTVMVDWFSSLFVCFVCWSLAATAHFHSLLVATMLADPLHSQLALRVSHCHVRLLRTGFCFLLSCNKLRNVLPWGTSSTTLSFRMVSVGLVVTRRHQRPTAGGSVAASNKLSCRATRGRPRHWRSPSAWTVARWTCWCRSCPRARQTPSCRSSPGQSTLVTSRVRTAGPHGHIGRRAEPGQGRTIVVLSLEHGQQWRQGGHHDRHVGHVPSRRGVLHAAAQQFVLAALRRGRLLQLQELHPSASERHSCPLHLRRLIRRRVLEQGMATTVFGRMGVTRHHGPQLQKPDVDDWSASLACPQRRRFPRCRDGGRGTPCPQWTLRQARHARTSWGGFAGGHGRRVRRWRRRHSTACRCRRTWANWLTRRHTSDVQIGAVHRAACGKWRWTASSRGKIATCITSLHLSVVSRVGCLWQTKTSFFFFFNLPPLLLRNTDQGV